MILARRSFIASLLALTALPRCASAKFRPAELAGSFEQGSLILGRLPQGALSPHITLDGTALPISSEGYFTFGIAYDRQAPLNLTVQMNGISETQTITPGQRLYARQPISGLPAKFVSPPEDQWPRIQSEKAKIAATRKLQTENIWYRDQFMQPVQGIITGTYGSRRILNGEERQPHFGVDIAAPEGTLILAPAQGRVVLAEADYYFDGGITVLDHGQGVSTTYLHQSRIDVQTGQVVQQGGVIGAVGQTGRATGPHLCWRMNWLTMPLDPMRAVTPR